MQYEQRVDVTAPPDRVWAALMDVEAWPRWTESMTSVERLDGAELTPGSRVRIKQPRMSRLDWTVTELSPGRSFTWTTSTAGVTVTGSHRITPGAGGITSLDLGLAMDGTLAGLVARLTGARTRRYLQLEANGLKRCSEAG